MYKSQKGFTLVELIVVIVLLGILGVTALGKFQDISGDAEQAALEGIAAELSAASSINYAKSLLGTPVLGIGTGAAGGTNNLDTTAGGNACLDTAGLELLFTGDDIPDIGSNVTTLGVLAVDPCTNPGDSYSCTLTAPPSAATTTATIICTE